MPLPPAFDSHYFRLFIFQLPAVEGSFYCTSSDKGQASACLARESLLKAGAENVFIIPSSPLEWERAHVDVVLEKERIDYRIDFISDVM